MTYLDKAPPMSRNTLSNNIETLISSGGSPRQKKSISENVDNHNVSDRVLDGESGHGLKSDGGMLTSTPPGSSNVGALFAYSMS